ncbi:MAG: hypothetical protein ACOC3J_06815 [Gemmatimonadota bacterium]
MAKTIITDPQSRANVLRELLSGDPLVQRFDLEVLRAEGSGERLLLRIRHNGRTFSIERDETWNTMPTDGLLSELRGELLGLVAPAMATAHSEALVGRAMRGKSWASRAR